MVGSNIRNKEPLDLQRELAIHHEDGILVDVSNMQADLPIDPIWVRRLVDKVLSNEAVMGAPISIGFVNNAAIRSINARYLNHDWPTDVISICYSQPDDVNLEGEIVISAELAAEMAVYAHCQPHDELALYLVHGLLHLCGYDDQTAEDVALMRSQEEVILAALEINNPYHRINEDLVMSEKSGRESVRWPR